jgi:MioC protein
MQNNACVSESMQYNAAPKKKQSRGRAALPGDTMPLDLTILVGTMTGKAQLVAQEIELMLDDGDTRVQTRMMDGLGAEAFAAGGLFLVCTSTYGQGDVPDNAKALYESLLTVRPDLSSVQYGVVALGDRTYKDTFCNGGRRFDAILSELGAKRIGDILFHDASSHMLPEEAAVEWVGPWMERVREQVDVEA